jgi:tetratricopeptide (TPR) repeat protein
MELRMTGRRPAAGLTALPWLLAALGAACAPSDDGGAPRPEAHVTQTDARQEGERPVSMPDLSRLPGPLQEQVRQRYAVLEQTRARRAPRVELGRAYGEFGLILMAAEYLDAALSCLLNAQALAPNDPRWPYYLGQFYLAKGERAKAPEFFKRALELRPVDFPTLVWLGEMYLDQGRPDDAHRLFAQAITLQPESAFALSGLGRAGLAQGDPARAAEHLERALALEPQAKSLHYPLAMAYRSLGELKKAEAHLRQRGSGEPTLSDPLMDEYNSLLESALAYQNRGFHAMQGGDFKAAAALFRRGLELEPENAALGHAFGTALHLSGEVDASIEQFEDVLRRSPAYAKAHFSLGVILVSKKRYEEALTRFAAAVQYDPDYTEARLSLAAGLQMMGRPEESLSHYEHVVKVDPLEVEAWIEGANVLVRLGRYHEARDWLAAAGKVHPERPEIVRQRETVEAFLTPGRGLK